MENSDEVLICPAGIAITLLRMEEQKGALLTKDEVLQARSQLRRFPIKQAFVEKYAGPIADFDYDNVWEDYVTRREEYLRYIRKTRIERGDTSLDLIAWTAAERFIRLHLPLHEGYQELMRLGEELCQAELWQEYRRFDYAQDMRGLTKWFEDCIRERPVGVHVFSFMLHDVPERFDLRGDAVTDADVQTKLWWWERRPEFDVNADSLYQSTLLDRWAWDERRSKDLGVVHEFFTSLAYTGLISEQLFRTTEPELLLGAEEKVWLTVGHGEYGYGTVLGYADGNGYHPQHVD